MQLSAATGSPFGASTLQLGIVAGLLDGLLRLPRRDISRRRLLGVAILLAGVALITLA